MNKLFKNLVYRISLISWYALPRFKDVLCITAYLVLFEFLATRMYLNYAVLYMWVGSFLLYIISYTLNNSIYYDSYIERKLILKTVTYRMIFIKSIKNRIPKLRNTSSLNNETNANLFSIQKRYSSILCVDLVFKMFSLLLLLVLFKHSYYIYKNPVSTKDLYIPVVIVILVMYLCVMFVKQLVFFINRISEIKKVMSNLHNPNKNLYSIGIIFEPIKTNISFFTQNPNIMRYNKKIWLYVNEFDFLVKEYNLDYNNIDCVINLCDSQQIKLMKTVSNKEKFFNEYNGYVNANIIKFYKYPVINLINNIAAFVFDDPSNAKFCDYGVDNISPAHFSNYLSEDILDTKDVEIYALYDLDGVINILFQENIIRTKYDSFLPDISSLIRKSIYSADLSQSLFVLFDLVELTFRLGLFFAIAEDDSMIDRYNNNNIGTYEQMFNIIAKKINIEKNIKISKKILLTDIEACENYLDCEFQGEGFDLLGLCYTLRYIRNKTRGHGIIEPNIVNWLHDFLLRTFLIFYDFFGLDNIQLITKDNNVFGFTNGNVIKLTPLLVDSGKDFFYISIPDKKNKNRYINYHSGEIFTPSEIAIKYDNKI